MQVMLRNRSDSSPVQDDAVNRHSNSLMVELYRPPPQPRDSMFIAGFPTDDQVEDHQSEFPEGM